MASVFSPVASKEPEVSISIRGGSLSREDVLKAIEVFKDVCAPLNRHWSDVKGMEVEAMGEYAPHRLAKGWTTGIFVRVKLPDKLSSLPNYDDRVGVISGHTLHYNLGGGSDPGIFGSKRVSQLLCGMPIGDSGQDTFKSIPALRFLRY
jgi:hypothetical protein